MSLYSEFSKDCLSEAQALSGLKKHGRNELPQKKESHFFSRLITILSEPMLLLLIVCAAIYLIMGDFTEGVMLGLSTFLVIGITIYQNFRSERALAALRDLSSPRALVLRAEGEKRIPAAFVVPHDLVVLHEGDRVPADGVLIESSHLVVDESLLTGESVPVSKSPAVATDPSSAPSSKVFSSTLVVGGSALMKVTQTGTNTEVGKIGRHLEAIEPDEMNLQNEISRIVKLFAWTGAFTCIVIVTLYGLTHHNWAEAFLVGISTQMALLPEEFPVVLTIFLAMGAWRLSRVQVLIRHPSAIERLGAVTVLCVDKTGTLTENRMTVSQLATKENSIALTLKDRQNLAEEFHPLLEYGTLASHRDPFDPMEKAIREVLLQGRSWSEDHLHPDWELIREYPLSKKLLAMSCVWRSKKNQSFVIAAKGAPEAVAELCHLAPSETENVILAAQKMAGAGLRVLGVAQAQFQNSVLPPDQHDFQFQWVGLIGLEDPLRAEVPAAVKKCRGAGIRVVMMTGDFPETAMKIAGQAGIDTSSILTGRDLETLPEKDLQTRVQTNHIYARLNPEQKLRIVKLLKQAGHVVAMTGDGVNDAPSLKSASVGISMGARGTDVAREASDMVLLDDNFASIVSGIERGRMIFSNIRKAMGYIVSIHTSIAGLALFPLLIDWPLLLLPVHIVFLN